MSVKRKLCDLTEEDVKRLRTDENEDEFGLKLFKKLYSTELPEELLELCQPLKCVLCHDLELTSAVVAKQHYLGKPHAKETEAFLDQWEKSAGKKAPIRVSQDLIEVTEENFCPVCQIHLTSVIVAEAHYRGKMHIKELQKITQRRNTPEIHETPVKEEGEIEKVVEEDENHFKFRCMPCSKDFPDSLAYQQHVYSPAHKVKVSAEESQESEFLCDLCNVQCADESAKSAHLQSVQHKLKEIRVNSEEDCLNEDSENKRRFESLKCEICTVEVNCADMMRSHLQGKQHKKKCKEKQIKSENSTGLLRCDLCNLAANSQIHLQDHLKGKKHLKKLKLQQQSSN